MKYEADIDLRNANTSHALLAELVGCEQRVLDVGCAAGDLGRVLKRRGCRVAGIEVDPAAAEVAETALDEVLVGDVNDIDVVEHFGKESFDVVVFGDVLEHLADPAAALRRVRPLLTSSGSIVASIPNVAHGSVRLSLLNGQFDYRPLGLLDATHLRFFTRASVHQVFREAGLVPVEMRRTTAGVFDTEIGLRRADFEPGIVDAVEGDPESTTYQFVLRAVPEESQRAIDGQAPDARPPKPDPRTRIGIWVDADPDDLRAALGLRVTRAELARRLPGAAIRSFSARREVQPSPHDGGMPVEALGTWSAERARQLATELDSVVVTGDLPVAGVAQGDSGHPARFLLDGMGPDADVDCPVMWSAVRLGDEQAGTRAGGDTVRRPAYAAVLDESGAVPLAQPDDDLGAAVPDPLLLVPRLLAPDALARRLEFVRMMGWFPTEGRAVVLEVDAALLPHADAVARALDAAVSATDAGVVLVRTDGREPDGGKAADAISASMSTPAHRVPDDALVDDVIAVVAAAAAVAVRSSTAMALAAAYGVPAAHLDVAGDATKSPLAALTGNAGAVVTRPEELADLLDGERFVAGGAVASLQARLDAHFDRIAAIADSAAAARPRTSDGRPVLPPSEYVSAMELAHRRMQERLDAERLAVAEHLVGLRRRHQADLRGLCEEADRLRAQHDEHDAARQEELRKELDRVAAELEALKSIRVLRMLRPARAIYARLRGSRL